MSNFRFGIGLLVALTLHATINKLSPNSLAFFNPYLILVIYYALGWRLVGVIFAGVAAGLVEDAFTISIPGLHAFTLTLVGYVVAYINVKVVLNGITAFGGCLFCASLANDALEYALISILEPVHMSAEPQQWLIRAIVTTLFGMLLYQFVTIVLKAEPLDTERRPKTW